MKVHCFLMAKRYSVRPDERHDIEGVFFDFRGARRADGRLAWDRCIIVCALECTLFEGEQGHTYQVLFCDGNGDPFSATPAATLSFTPNSDGRAMRSFYVSPINEGVADVDDDSRPLLTVPCADVYSVRLLIDDVERGAFDVHIA